MGPIARSASIPPAGADIEHAPPGKVQLRKGRPYELLDDVKVIRWFSGNATDRLISAAWAKVYFPEQFGKGAPRSLTPFEKAARTVGSEWKLAGKPEQGFGRAIPLLTGVFLADESINSAKLSADARQFLRRALEHMDDAERKQTIAALMAYIGKLQTSGALESVPSDRLARVAKLIGEAAEIVSVDPDSYIPLFRDREIDPATGKKPTALEWFDQVWKPLVEAGEATGDDIRQSDPAFYSNWASMLTKRGQKVSEFLPPSPTRGKIQETEEERRKRLSSAASKRVQRWRKNKAAEPS